MGHIVIALLLNIFASYGVFLGEQVLGRFARCYV